MTKDEFHEWRRYHCSKFPGLVKWLASFDKPKAGDGGEEVATRPEVLQSWFRSLSSISLDAAKHATDLMGSAAYPEPRGYERHPIAVAQIARDEGGTQRKRGNVSSQRGPEFIPLGKGRCEERFKCGLCRDYGMVEVWSAAAMRAVMDRTIASLPVPHRRNTVKCTCEASHGIGIDVRYDERLMLPTTLGVEKPEAIEQLTEHVDAVLSRRMTSAEWTP